jgi:hypothetical protein
MALLEWAVLLEWTKRVARMAAALSERSVVLVRSARMAALLDRAALMAAMLERSAVMERVLEQAVAQLERALDSAAVLEPALDSAAVLERALDSVAVLERALLMMLIRHLPLLQRKINAMLRWVPHRRRACASMRNASFHPSVLRLALHSVSLSSYKQPARPRPFSKPVEAYNYASLEIDKQIHASLVLIRKWSAVTI